MRIFSLIFGVVLLLIGVPVLSLYFTNIQYGSTPFVGAILGNELTNVLVFGAAVTFAGVVFVAFGAFTSPPTKLSVRDVERLGLTGHVIKDAAAGGQVSERGSSEPNPSIASQTPTPLSDKGGQTVRVSSLAKTILANLPRGKTSEDIAKDTGVDESVIIQKIQEMKAKGFLSESGKLTQKGYEALQHK